MDLQTLEKRYLRAPAMYGRTTGIWPGLNTTFVQFTKIFVCIIAAFSIITQGARLVVNYSLDVLLEQLPFICVPIGVAIKHYGFTSDYAKSENLFESMVRDWRKKMTKDEIQIMEHYADKGVFYALIYLANAYFIASVFILVPFVPYILDIILPLNETRPRVHMYEAYYFIKNQDDYYYCITVYTIISLLVAMFTFIAADTILIYIVQHCCGLLALAGHRFEYALHKWSSTDKLSKNDYKEMYNAVTYGISTHERALDVSSLSANATLTLFFLADKLRIVTHKSCLIFCPITGTIVQLSGRIPTPNKFLVEIESSYKLPIFVLVSASALTFTATLLRASKITFTSETYHVYGYIVAQLVHMFFLTTQGQFVVNVHDSVYQQGYDALWYIADIRTQALFLLILRQNLTPPLLTAGGLAELNLDTFAEIVKASVSYYVVLKSL